MRRGAYWYSLIVLIRFGFFLDNSLRCKRYIAGHRCTQKRKKETGNLIARQRLRILAGSCSQEGCSRLPARRGLQSHVNVRYVLSALSYVLFDTSGSSQEQDWLP